MFEGYKLLSNYVRLRINPENVFAFGLMSVCESNENVGQSLESIASRHRCPTEMDAYERLLVDAMMGDATHFAREDYVEEAWRIVDPVLKAGTPVTEYEPGTWGPAEAESRVCPPYGWVNPIVTTEAKR
jgi:glucose-6-phosphate 1-dehydrogenase